MHYYQVLRRPVVTEKSMGQTSEGKYTFEVAREANKVQIKEAVQKIFKVHVTAVNVDTVPGKRRRSRRAIGYSNPWKKAVVSIKPGEKIEFFEGV